MEMKSLITTTVFAVTMAVSPMVWGQVGPQTAEEQARHDQLRIAVQEICPVSGKKLGSMGHPVKVTVGESKEEVFLCCAGCAKGKINPEYWATIHANIARAQGKCPIMKREIPEKGAKWTVVQGEVIYVCCPPCLKKVAADPEAALAQVDTYYTAYLQSKNRR
jgi:hypothetical protein